MKPKIAIPLALAGMFSGASVSAANANGWFAGHPSLFYLCAVGAGVMILVSVIGAVIDATRKPKNEAQHPLAHVENRLENIGNPQQHVNIIFSDTRANQSTEQEQQRHENLILAFMREQHEKRPAGTQRSLIYHVEGIASATHLTMQQTKGALENLYLKNLLYRSTLDVKGDFIYWLNAD
jgi:hypothetical protein